jgi:hypothetical protein
LNKSGNVSGDKEDYSNLSNEKVLFIYNRFTGMAPYSHEFVLGGIDPQVLSGFVSAMSSFMGEVTGDEHTRWKTTYGSEHVFLVEGGDWVAGVLAVSRETNEVRSKLRRVVEEFEESFESLKNADVIEGKLFVEFDHYVRRVFIGDRLSRHSQIFKRPDWDIRREYEKPSIAFKVMKFLRYVKDGQDLGSVAKKASITLEAAKDLTSRALWNNVVFVKYIPTDEDIISISERASSILFDNDNPLNLDSLTIKVVTALDGRTSLYEFLKLLKPKQVSKVVMELGDLMNRGFIQRISIERHLLLVNECVINKLVRECVEVVGIETIKNHFTSAIEKGISKHPWIGRLRATDTLNIQSRLDDTMTPSDLDQMFEAVQFVIRYIKSQMEKAIGKSEAESMLQAARDLCHRKWSYYLWDVTV